ncbi:MAG: hypothetical protein ACLFST_03470 [Spirochaetia bacterium]
MLDKISSVCFNCFKALEYDFRFCPYCGSEIRTRQNFEELISGALDILELRVSRNRGIRLNRLYSVLVDLEEELDKIISQAEKEQNVR